MTDTTPTALYDKKLDAESELRFRALADAIPLIVWTANASGETDYYNSQWEAYTGLSAEQAKGWDWSPVLHPDDLQNCIDRWTHAFKTGEPYEIEYRFKRAADGTYRWHLGRAIPFKDPAGNIVKWFGICTDIDDQVSAKNTLNQAYLEIEKIVAERTTELAAANQQLARHNEIRKAAVEALQRDSARLNEIITTQTMLAKANLDLDAFINLVVERMAILTLATGAVVEMVEGDEMVYQAATGILNEHIGLRLKIGASLSGLCIQSREVLNCIDTENDPRVDIVACRAIGVRAMVVAPLLNAGNPVGVLKIVASEPFTFTDRDLQTLRLMAGLIGAAIGHQTDYDTNLRLLSERTEAVTALEQEIARRIEIEESVRENELRTRMILESSYDAFIAMDSNGVIIDWNQQAEITFGWTREEALGEILGNLIIPIDFRQAHIDGMKKFVATGVGDALGKRIELPGLRKSGEEFPLEVTIRALPHKNGHEFCAFLRDITERKHAEERLFQLAHSDYLTDLPNRSLFNDRIVEAMQRSKRTRSLMALMYLDVDKFKSINDNYGHAVGDGLLIEFSKRLSASVRATDTVARLGGDEFTIIAEVLKSPDDAQLIASKIIKHVRKEMCIHDFNLNVTTSIGISFYQGEDIDADQLINNADRALYRAKQAGRDRMSL
ncbi:MAG TPA: diguanylate cyclase [Cellvibrio sp.]|nr:diguanylate cyclase [Cellvibrio sp.]